MFDGADLSLAYGPDLQSTPVAPPAVSSVAPSMSSPVLPPPAVAAQGGMPNVPQVAPTSHAMPPDTPYNPPQAMFDRQPGPKRAPSFVPEDSFWDRLAHRKPEVLKMFILALVVLLGLSMHDLTLHYLSDYIGRAFLSDTQEFLVRLCYPAAVLLALWLLKAMA